jgi:acyl-coenzyme A synthetase/AMP-(fatty) acid ligase
MTDFTIPVTPLTGMNWGLFGMWDEMTYIIKSSGYRIGPFEVESVLLEHPAVLEVAVTGVPDPVRGFNVKATLFFVPDLRLATNW